MIVILGGGLAGMSTAYHLGRAAHRVIEAESTPGGLCRSREVDGFVFDYTGHLLHLRDPRITALVDELLPGALETIVRRAAVRTHGVTLPFPWASSRACRFRFRTIRAPRSRSGRWPSSGAG
jgi:protoporphyrinogen oxidase